MTARTVIGFPRWLATPTRLNFLLPGKRRAVAHRLQARHATLTEFLEVLGVDAAHVGQNVAGIEHHISRSTLEAIGALTKALRKHPLVLVEVLKRGTPG
jgi:Mn-dependent DtxR family transcriptional regulator